MKTHQNLSREERIKKIMDLRRNDLCLVMENLVEEQNISAILRTAESFGVGLVCIIHPQGKKPKISKGVSSGASKWLNVEYFTDTKECFQKLKKDKFTIIGALVNPDSELLWNQNFSGKTAIVVGNEPNGLSKTAQKLVDKNIYLPMFGLTESLNVSVAASIFLYEVVRNKEKND